MFGLAGVNLATYTGWGSVTYWNAFVANLEMHGRGSVDDDRLDDAKQFSLASVVEHYDSCQRLGLTAGEKRDLVQYLRSR